MDKKREYKVAVYMTEGEKRRIRQEAASQGMQMSEYIRKTSLPEKETDQEATAWTRLLTET